MKTVYVIEDQHGCSLKQGQLRPFETYEADLIGITYLPNSDSNAPEDEMTLHIRIRT